MPEKSFGTPAVDDEPTGTLLNTEGSATKNKPAAGSKRRPPMAVLGRFPS